jgi:DNA repair photolyase
MIEWLEPAPIDDAAFSGLMGDYIHLVAPETEADKHVLLFVLMTELGCLIGNHAYYLVGDSKLYTNEFISIVGASALSRKGIAQSRVDKLVIMVNPNFASHFVDGLATGQGIVWELAQREKACNGDTRVLCVEEEFKSILTKSGLSVILRKAWDAKQVSQNIKTGAYGCEHPHLCIITDITPDELVTTIPVMDLVNGYANRFLWVMAKSSENLLPHGGLPLEKLNQTKLSKIVNGIRSAVKFAQTVNEVKFDASADIIWVPYYNAIDRSPFSPPVESRENAHISKLALLYALLDKSPVISAKHLQAAIAAWKYSRDSSRVLFPSQASKRNLDEEKIMKLLGQHTDGLTTSQVTFMALQNNKSAEPILKKLESDGKVKSIVVKPPTGRPSDRWFITTPTISTPLIQIEPASGPTAAPSTMEIIRKSPAPIYTPTGLALEYSAWACNPYHVGCGHKCLYCFEKTRKNEAKKALFDAGAIPKENWLEKLRIDAAKCQALGITGQVLMSFTSDVYNPHDVSMTRPTIEIIQEFGMGINVLTKAGMRSLDDIDLFRPTRDCYGATLTALDDEMSLEWEPCAALPDERMEALKTFHRCGIYTWCSLEPVLDVEASLEIVRQTHTFIDHYKIGKSNYMEKYPTIAAIDWEDYTHRMMDVVAKVGASHYFKKFLQRYLPVGYNNPMRIDQHN